MLDNETKRRIDTARDILVGKIPTPQQQVEQITFALIYKFMDDMDKESIGFGGKPSYFVGDLAKNSFSNLFAPNIGGKERYDLYEDGLKKLALHPSKDFPGFFRKIFEGAKVPYSDIETLSLFLKTIGDFTYSHSEKLGDAFEYLLSIMGSQGDAGQFRTPRHIIDFIVEVLQPKKTESICDPACGTAGFLISSYKHILKANSKKNKGDLLTPDDRKKLMRNFVGYDISPDMVRLSLVNMYLHGFITPNIYEYDTLTSEDRWSEYFDVIIANPPFMTPTGGIKPHKKFTVQANRSEVLFVDYIAEHIHPGTGRAGIIVPEGIIFQSATAYKALRKMLVDKNYLYAVVSLPAGVFQPYSGVKTSILLMDKTLAKKTDKILFVKIENDGFDLGAQRREIDKNDLPEALNVLEKYKKCLNHDSPDYPNFDDYLKAKDGKENHGNPLIKKIIVQTVDKKKIAEKGDYNLSIDRYRENGNAKQSHFEMVRLGDVVEVLDSKRKPITKSDRKAGKYPYYGATGIVDYVDDFIFDEKLVLVGEDGAKWNSGDKTAFIAEGKYWVNNHAHVLRVHADKLIDTFLVEILNLMDLNKFITGVTVPKLNQEKLRDIEIPLPPIEIQQQIVSKIESYQSIINGAKQVVENYKPQIEIKEDWEMVELGDEIDFVSGVTLSIPIVKMKMGYQLFQWQILPKKEKLQLTRLEK